MFEFIDLAGASGVRYRFQRVPDLNAIPVIAGNFVYVRGHGEGLTLVCAGTGDSLSAARKLWNEAMQQGGAEGLFVRRNVSRRARKQEHEDIVSHIRPMIDAAEDFGD